MTVETEEVTSEVMGWCSHARLLASLFGLAGTLARTLAPHEARWADKWKACLRDVWAALRVATKVGRPGSEDKGRFAGQTAEKCHRPQGHDGVTSPSPSPQRPHAVLNATATLLRLATLRCALQRVPGVGAHALGCRFWGPLCLQYQRASFSCA